MNGEVRSKSGNIDVAAYETASLSRCNGKEVGKTLKPSAPSEKKAVYKQTLIILKNSVVSVPRVPWAVGVQGV